MDDTLVRMRRGHEFLVCVDSDGCAFDTMSLKQKDCFFPATERAWELERFAPYARETALFVNLYSSTRGMNRYPALVRTLRLLDRRPEARALGYACPDLEPLEEWIRQTSALSQGALTEHIRSLGRTEPVLERTVEWVRTVDANIERLVRHIPPFPGVREALRRFSVFADIVVVSTATNADLRREWGEHGLLDLVTAVAGQETGSKADCIRKANGGRYPAGHVLMIGDAPGDHRAALDAGALFYPILADREEESWRLAEETVAEQFRSGTYAETGMGPALERFRQTLLAEPPWPEIGADAR
ncbi:MAG: HAD family hydrolase [Clostridia bacterium]|nr:HAD family hydrolase [Clostridia bacterium]